MSRNRKAAIYISVDADDKDKMAKPTLILFCAVTILLLQSCSAGLFSRRQPSLSIGRRKLPLYGPTSRIILFLLREQCLRLLRQCGSSCLPDYCNYVLGGPINVPTSQLKEAYLQLANTENIKLTA
ncbi:uncharacterized protein LOC106014240 [Aplysia californica]|uniref:Uncharacterized protein LOC106014240 n=1 Tax=Aplysia californica TaxID=6500 RepID=A0ABM1AG45_APLCA|nr:uncharacterized protein LOC106014240 [Aplysia californica]